MQLRALVAALAIAPATMATVPFHPAHAAVARDQLTAADGKNAYHRVFDAEPLLPDHAMAPVPVQFAQVHGLHAVAAAAKDDNRDDDGDGGGGNFNADDDSHMTPTAQNLHGRSDTTPSKTVSSTPSPNFTHFFQPLVDYAGLETVRPLPAAPRDGVLELWSERGFRGYRHIYGRKLHYCDTIDTFTEHRFGFGKSAAVRAEGACCLLYTDRGCHGYTMMIGGRMATLAPYQFDNKVKSVLCMPPEGCKRYFAEEQSKTQAHIYGYGLGIGE
ncbi:hypothetical protein SPI_06022 [Niveomyces insectorum RCEF 264]|uniref:Uncharacterized protein n=1 Tax=Niveomyces insectorum RCEF 264 TaxID=1081102 RepID=A0A167SQ63_9HYPO|nr:hypothetical protein SPI_06022 [Niveomyces insectorum RCEF 264]